MKVALFANTDWYLFNFRLSLAKFLTSKGFEVLMVSPPGEYGRRFEASGLRWLSVPLVRRSLHPIRESRLVIHLSHMLKIEKVDLLHCFTIKPVLYGAIAARLSRTPYRVYAITGLGHVFTSESPKAKWLRIPVNLMLRFALNDANSRLIVQNMDDTAIFKSSRLVDASNIRLIRGSGVDCDLFRPLQAGRNGKKTFRVLLASRILWEKGIAEYVESARILHRMKRPIEFFIAGAPDPGNPSSVPQEQVQNWEREGVVRILGHVQRMANVLRDIDLAVLPSYREGVPRSLLEAASAGVAVVATDVPGCRDVIDHGVNGLLVPQKDPVALAEAIAHLMDNPDTARKMGYAGRKKVLAEFDERLIIDKTFDVYREFLRNDRETSTPSRAVNVWNKISQPQSHHTFAGG